MRNLYWLSEAQLARLQPFVGKTVHRDCFLILQTPQEPWQAARR